MGNTPNNTKIRQDSKNVSPEIHHKIRSLEHKLDNLIELRSNYSISPLPSPTPSLEYSESRSSPVSVISDPPLQEPYTGELPYRVKVTFKNIPKKETNIILPKPKRRLLITIKQGETNIKIDL